jgi:hypothetical protein
MGVELASEAWGFPEEAIKGKNDKRSQGFSGTTTNQNKEGGEEYTALNPSPCFNLQTGFATGSHLEKCEVWFCFCGGAFLLSKPLWVASSLSCSHNGCI